MNSSQDDTQPPDSSSWQGIWKRDREEPTATPPGKHLLWHDVFVAHPDGSVSVHLLAVSPQPTDSPDGVYRMETLWRDGTLFYRLANGLEVELADWRDGHFEMEGDGLRRIYRRIEAGEVVELHRPLLDADRPLSTAQSPNGEDDRHG